ncbi:hypothetical protein [Limosilactobacillus reuteri]|jgi:hypothetical protein|uniref:hypothetical protein n=1 Tax=Limosilactobacillus reuteri TaxID=1598 RepID=UPI001042C257|nr:hypothetical protein [Limosilactobacillus reuteri]
MFFKRHKLNSFLNSLNYWQTINLYTTLKQARMDISFEDAKLEAIENFGDSDMLRYMLEEAINSPNPKHRTPTNKSLF